MRNSTDFRTSQCPYRNINSYILLPILPFDALIWIVFYIIVSLIFDKPDFSCAGLTFLLGHSGFSKLNFGFFGQNPLILAENRRILAKIYTF